MMWHVEQATEPSHAPTLNGYEEGSGEWENVPYTPSRTISYSCATPRISTPSSASTSLISPPIESSNTTLILPDRHYPEEIPRIKTYRDLLTQSQARDGRSLHADVLGTVSW